MFVEFILLFSSFYYIGSLIYFIFGLYREENFATHEDTPPVSVIIAVRNGEKNISRILTSLKNQTYNLDLVNLDTC